MPDDSCNNCHFWRRPHHSRCRSNVLTEGKGECRFHAPNESEWPYTEKSDWCAEHRPPGWQRPLSAREAMDIALREGGFQV